MNNDNDLNLHSMTKLSGWLRYWETFKVAVRSGGSRVSQNKL